MDTLLIDVGSTNIKWAVYNHQSHLIKKQAKVPFPKEKSMPYPYFEVELSKITSVFEEIIQLNLGVKQIFISTQMHGYILADENGSPLTDYISWKDERSRLFPFPYSLSKVYGVDVKPNLPRASIYAQSNLNQNFRANQFFTLGSYLAYYLTGNNKTHISDAAATGFYNVITLSCDEVNMIMPQATKDVESVGKYLDIVVYTPVGDQQASILGAGATPIFYVLNLGTAAQICTINDTFITGEFESRPYFHGKTLCTVTNLMGGYLIDQYEDSDLEKKLIINYTLAIEKLPKRDALIITGGLIQYKKPLIDRVVKQLKIKYQYNEGLDAINGLKIIMEELLCK